MARNWFPEERKKQSEAIRKWKPWENSTGPQFEEGKQAVRDNALKHGLRSKEGIELSRMMVLQKQFVRAIIR